MYFLYKIALWFGFVLLIPRFLYDALTDGKWAAGFSERLGNVPKFNSSGRSVVLLHCVSVGETNAALPLAKKIKQEFPDIALVVSTTTRTGQHVARDVYLGLADAVVYFPFDLGFSVERFLRRIVPDVVLITETEIWPNFIRTACRAGAKVTIVNGRVSQRSFRRYSRIKGFLRRIFADITVALMQTDADAERIKNLGLSESKIRITGNLKFDIELDERETPLTNEFRERFAIDGSPSLVLASSTHEPEEKLILEALDSELGRSCRLMIAPRHPERFATVERELSASGHSVVRRSSPRSAADVSAQVILLDSMGELRAVYPLADIVFVGGSLIRHGGQSIFEPAAAGKPIVTGPYTANFDAAVKEFLSKGALVQLPDANILSLAAAFDELLSNVDRRRALGQNALGVMEANRGAVDRTLEYLTPLLTRHR